HEAAHVREITAGALQAHFAQQAEAVRIEAEARVHAQRAAEFLRLLRGRIHDETRVVAAAEQRPARAHVGLPLLLREQAPLERTPLRCRAGEFRAPGAEVRAFVAAIEQRRERGAERERRAE